ncbi:P-loop containing nucleoside triphosphate hydrolase protein [Syncephalis fuscata]|nr:P-loop containing nucleoside triphosphate hydrolase protein [Syncephalis fuscata]
MFNKKSAINNGKRQQYPHSTKNTMQKRPSNDSNSYKSTKESSFLSKVNHFNNKNKSNNEMTEQSPTESFSLAKKTTKQPSQSTFHSKHYMPLPGEVTDVIQRLRIPNRPGSTSLEMSLRCPSCTKSSSNKSKSLNQMYTPQYTARLDKLSGSFNCQSCGTTAGWVDFLRMVRAPEVMGDNNTATVSLSDDNGQEGNRLPAIDVSGYVNDLKDHPDILAWISGTKEDQMHIQPAVLEAYGVGVGHLSAETPIDDEAIHKSNINDNETESSSLYVTFPRLGIRVDPKVDPTSNSSESPLVITRVRGVDWNDQERVIYEPANGAAAGLFGYQLAFKSKKRTVVITPREFDAMAVYQSTNVPAVALPSSQYQLPLDALPLLEQFDKFTYGLIMIWLAMQPPLNLLTNWDLVDVLLLMPASNQKGRPLNAWEAMVAGHDLNEMLKNAKPHEHRQVITFNRLRDEIFREILYPDQLKGVQSTTLPTWNKIMKGHRPGELTVLTGPTGAGKTTVISQLSLDFCHSGISTLWGSFEINNARLAKKMLFQYAGQDLSNNPMNSKSWPIDLSSTQIASVLDAMQYALYAHDVQHVIIDNLQFMTSGQGRGIERWEIQEDALSLFRRFATDNNVHVTLVVHPRKEDKEQLDINSIFGSAKITQEADNVIILQKITDKLRYLDVKKHRFDGTLGILPYKYNPQSLRIMELSPKELEQFKRTKSSSPSSSSASV